MDVVTDGSTDATELDAPGYNAFVADLNLANVELISVHGERIAAGQVEQTRFDLTAGYMTDAGVVRFRYEVSAHLTDGAGVALGSAGAAILVTVRTTREPGRAYIEQFGATSGALIAHPYLREAVASTAQRIGFPGVLLPMVQHQPLSETEED
ncbi:MAG TPA: hypothetical protein VN969_41400 [Streptosporangiaceae bacterium]|nr:hypothetical protein [Streptosporangiaceae bacterium]